MKVIAFYSFLTKRRYQEAVEIVKACRQGARTVVISAVQRSSLSTQSIDSHRTSSKELEELGSTDVLQKAIAKTAEILTSHHPGHIAPDVDQAIHDRFSIRLPVPGEG